MKKFAIAAAALAISVTGAYAQDITGNWRTDSGETAAITGGGPYTITLKTGKYAGKRIGSMSAAGKNRYSGTITDPADDKTYSGSASLNGNSLRMKGCVAKILCRSQNWKRL